MYLAKLYMQCYSKTEQEAQQWKPYWFFNGAVTGNLHGYQHDLIGMPTTGVQRKWIVDSGSCFDLVNKGELEPRGPEIDETYTLPHRNADS